MPSPDSPCCQSSGKSKTNSRGFLQHRNIRLAKRLAQFDYDMYIYIYILPGLRSYERSCAMNPVFFIASCKAIGYPDIFWPLSIQLQVSGAMPVGVRSHASLQPFISSVANFSISRFFKKRAPIKMLPGKKQTYISMI